MKRRWQLTGLFKADLGLVTECSDKSICCGFDNTTCCAKREGFWIKFGDATTMNPVDAVLLYSTIITTVLSSIYPTSNSLSPTALTSIPSPLPLASTSSPQSKHDQSMSASFPISGITSFQQQMYPKIYTYQGPWSTLQSSSFCLQHLMRGRVPPYHRLCIRSLSIPPSQSSLFLPLSLPD